MVKNDDTSGRAVILYPNLQLLVPGSSGKMEATKLQPGDILCYHPDSHTFSISRGAIKLYWELGGERAFDDKFQFPLNLHFQDVWSVVSMIAATSGLSYRIERNRSGNSIFIFEEEKAKKQA